MFKVILLPDTHIALVNSKPHALSNRQFKLMLFVTAAKQVIAKVWKTDSLDISLVKQGVTQSPIHAKTEAILIIYLNSKPCGHHGLNISYRRALTPLYYSLKGLRSIMLFN